MTPEAELYLWERVPVNTGAVDGRWPRDVIREMLASGMIQNPKQAWATLSKWTDAGCYEYGVTLDLGWKHPDSPTPARLVRLTAGLRSG